ncbi:MAG TPA: nuclear transport factor 2 family protein [Chitinophagaceae bacterium]|nr:nuclear transport factor 2 family protein [Chitinophagaceae bacterium]
MKQFHTLISAALATAILFAACTSGASDKETTATTEVAPTTTTATNAADENQQKLEANKKLVSDFLQSLFGDKDSTAIDKYIGDNIIQHSPLLHDTKEGFKGDLRPYYSRANLPKTKVDIKQIAADGDKVWVMVRDVAPNGKVFARIDIFKVENGKITEHWSVEQAEPKESDNKNTMF